MSRKKLPAKGDERDVRCAFDDYACTPEGVTSDDYCNGCGFHICEAHSQNLELPFGGHDVCEHLNGEQEDTDA